ncbi:MAG: hypothetical protein QOD75_947 [Blastocatellia bacterium]|nr:hypothetical protein [Blastocatellia bacterium]
MSKGQRIGLSLYFPLGPYRLALSLWTLKKGQAGVPVLQQRWPS